MLCIALWSFMPGTASAGHFYTGEEIPRHCENRSSLFDQGRCFGFLSGVVDYIEFARKAYPNKRGHAFYYSFAEICVPAGVTQGELQKVWVRFPNRGVSTARIDVRCLAR